MWLFRYIHFFILAPVRINRSSCWSAEVERDTNRSSIVNIESIKFKKLMETILLSQW